MSGIAEQPGGLDSRDIGQFVSLLLEALRRSGQSQAALATIMYYSKSLLTKVIKGDSTPDERFFRIFFERGVPFLIAFGGVVAADEVRAMASAAGVLLTDGELRVAAGGARDPEFLAQAREQSTPSNDELTAADMRLANEFAKVRADTFEQSIERPPEPARPAPTPERPVPDSRRWIDTVDLLSARHCGHTPAVFGRQLHIVETINRPVWLPGDGGLILGHLVFEALAGKSALLAGVPGSGRTTLLRMLGYQLMSHWEPGRPQAVYMRAHDILKQAGRRRNVVELLAEQIIEAGGAETGEFKAVAAALDDLDRARRLVWLVDDVDRLSESEQIDLASHFVVSQAIYVVTTWQALDAQRRLSTGAPPMILSLPDLEPDEQYRILDRFFIHWSETMPSHALRQALLDTMSALAKLPIGLAAIYAQMEVGQATPLLILEAAVREYFARADLDFPTDWSDWPAMPATARALAILGTAYLNDLEWNYPESKNGLVSLEGFRGYAEEFFRSDWYALPATRQCLFTEIEGRPVASFYNDDLLCYWAARRNTFPWHYNQGNLHGRVLSLIERVNALRDEHRDQVS